MNKQETIEAIKVMQAFVDNGTTRYVGSDDEDKETSYPIWNWRETDYFIKPEPRECYVAFKEGKSRFVIDSMENNVPEGYEYVLMKEPI